MKRILVTGSNGQLGKSIQKASINYPGLEFYFKSSKDLNITKAHDIDTVLEENNFDYCINCAAYTNVEQAEKTPKIAYEVNAEAVKKIALTCLKHNVILIHISTDYVFDGEKEEPYTVYDTPSPINEYGKSKLQGEKYIQEILKDYFIIRTSWLYSEFGNNFYKTILEKAKTEKILHITDEEKGCPTDANNLASFILEEVILKNLKMGIHNFCDSMPMTWFDFAKRIIKKNGLNNTVKVQNYSTFANRPKNSILQ